MKLIRKTPDELHFRAMPAMTGIAFVPIFVVLFYWAGVSFFAHERTDTALLLLVLGLLFFAPFAIFYMRSATLTLSRTQGIVTWSELGIFGRRTRTYPLEKLVKADVAYLSPAGTPGTVKSRLVLVIDGVDGGTPLPVLRTYRDGDGAGECAKTIYRWLKE